MEEKVKSFFRKSAIDNMANPEELNKPIYFGISGSWIIILSIIGLVTSFVIWGIFSSFPVCVDGWGVILNKSRLHPVMAGVKGIITEVDGRRGDVIKSGEILAKIKASENNRFMEKVIDITAPCDGVIIQKWLYPSLYVSESDLLFTVEEPNASVNPEVIAYIPSDCTPMVKPDMEVHVIIKSLENTYGFMRGKVDSISVYQTTRELMFLETGNFQTVDDIIKHSENKYFFTSVSITLMEDNDGTYQWSQKDPSFSPETGSLCNCSIIAAKKAPLQTLINHLFSGL